MGVLSYLSTENVLFCNLLQNPARLELWNPIMVMRKRLRPPQGLFFPGNSPPSPPQTASGRFFPAPVHGFAPNGRQ